ncbi:hypothetical protein FGRMN_5192 [Fusarium graminum]|nr:hypothetical protein FGRMN_5192 [Fusarium graminum]
MCQNIYAKSHDIQDTTRLPATWIFYTLLNIYQNSVSLNGASKATFPDNQTVISLLKGVESDYPGLRQALDMRCTTLVAKETTSQMLESKEVEGSLPENIDQACSHIVTFYQLLEAFPVRFPGYSQTGAETVRGHSDDNWQAAFCTWQYYKLRRSRACQIESNGRTTKTPSLRCGSFTDQVVQEGLESEVNRHADEMAEMENELDLGHGVIGEPAFHELFDKLYQV